MSTTADSLLEQALALPPEDRANLASGLLASLDDDDADPDEVDRLWGEETERRMTMLESGAVEPVTLDHLIERVDGQRTD